MSKIAIDFRAGTLKRNEECVVGIDLGTTNSLIAYIRDGNAMCIGDKDGGNVLVPSIVHIDQENRIWVGDQAKRMLSINPESTVYSVKRLMGKSFQDIAQNQFQFSYSFSTDQSDRLIAIKINDRYYSPVELSAFILKSLKERGEKILNKKIAKAVITVPAYFNDNQRQATKDAGRLAGLDVMRIINEPTAASLAYGIGLDPSESKKVLVYDLGGGTFDVSVLQIEQGVFEVLATNGDNFLGGDDIDYAVMKYWASQFGFYLPEDFKQRNMLRLLAEEAKIALSDHLTHTTVFNDTVLTLDQKILEDLTLPLLDRTIQLCQSALKDARAKVEDIDDVILVGGSTKMPIIKKRLEQFFKRSIPQTVDPDQAVALGAAIQADILSGNRKDTLLLDVTPLSLGIETIGGLMDVVVPRNSKIPTQMSRQYSTSKDGQTKLKISVYQGERDLVEHNRLLGEFILVGIPPMPAGMPKLEVGFQIDADGILKVSAKELRSGIEQSIEIKSQFTLRQEEIANMLKDSLHFAQQDIQQKALIEAVNEARNIIQSSYKFIEQNKSWLSDEQITRLQHHISKLKQSIGRNRKDEILQIMEELNEYAKPLSHEALNRLVNEHLSGNKIGDL